MVTSQQQGSRGASEGGDSHRMSSTMGHSLAPGEADELPEPSGAVGSSTQPVNAEILLAQLALAREALAEADQRYRNLVDAMSAAVYTTDVEGRLTLYNEAAANLWGRRPTLGDTRFCGSWKLYTVDGFPLPHDQCPMAVSLREQRPIPGCEALAERPDGSQVPFAAYPAPLRDTSGAIVGAVNVLVDLTERRAAEAALQQSDDRREAIGRLNQDLEVRVRNEVLAREEIQARLAQAQRMEALGRLAGGIAHDFNNILQALQGTLALIERRASDAQNVSRYARAGLDVAERGNSITQRLLIFSRHGELRTEIIDAEKLLAELVEVLSPTLGPAIALRREVTAGVPNIAADKGQLETVLINVATNARDAMPCGGTLTFAASAETISTGGAAWRCPDLRSGRYVRIDVSDNGVGMDPATLARVSEPFFTTKAIGKGTGLGMAMAQGFAKQSGGSLQVQSTLGHGTKVTLWLPVAGPVSSDVSLTATKEAPDPAIKVHARLLLVDDDLAVRETMSEQLQLEGFDLLVAENGLEAFNLLDKDENIDLLVSDLSMPEMDGLSLIRQAQRRRPGLPAILLTGHVEDPAVFAGNLQASQAFKLLQKPVTGRQLLQCVQSLLRAKPEADQLIAD